MASLSYEQIVKGLDQLDATEIRLLQVELDRRARKAPKKRLSDFYTEGPLKSPGEDWVQKQRREWDDQGS